MGNAKLCITQENADIESLLVQLSKSSEDTSKVKILVELADKTNWSDINSSQEYAKQALALSQKLNYLKGMAYSKYWLSKVFSDYEFDLTEKLALQSLDHAKKIKDSILMAEIYNVLGNLKSKLGHNDDALNLYNISLDIYLRQNEDSSAAAIYNNLGILYAVDGVDSLSIYYYQKAASINKKTKNYLWLAINYLNIGNDLIDIDRLDTAFDYLQRSLALADKHNYNRIYPWIYNNLSQYYLKNNNYNNSVKFADSALYFSRQQNNWLQERSALELLNETYNKKPDLKKAYHYLDELKKISDSINAHNRLKEIDLMEMKFRYEEEAKQHELEKVLAENQYYKQELIYIIILIVAGLLIFIFILLYFIQRNRIQRKNFEQKTTLLEKEKLTNDLEFKNKELITNVIYLLKKNEFISEISNKLKNTNFDSADKLSDTIARIISELDKSVTHDTWTEFEVRFQEVHVDFYNKLSKQYPELTPNELRLCAFLRLNMTSKEISDITLQSADSIKTARYRLRKKLDISRENNLITFLTQF